MSKFQAIILGVFGFIIIVSVIIFSRYQGSGAESAKVLIWGTIPNIEFQTIISKTSLHNNKLLEVSYEQKSEATIDNEFVEALAAGGGPDLIILPHQKIERQKNKLVLIPYSAYSQALFKQSFISGTEIYLDPAGTGVVALPFSIDPLVMYWNRSLFTAANVTQVPKYWDEFYSLSNSLSKKDSALNITQSAASLGEFANITNAKELVSNLLMQAGTPIVQVSNGRNLSVLSSSFNKAVSPADAALTFYTQFSNPAKAFYSWNRSLPKSSDYFLSGKLGLYFGFASELYGIRQKNPNLDFDVAMVPASRDVGVNVSYANFTGLAISRGSKVPTAALQVASILTSTQGGKAVSEVLGLPPLRRDLLAENQSLSYKDVFYKSAIRSGAWLDPDPAQTSVIFKNMIESITSGRARIAEAVAKASNEIGDLLDK